MYFGFLNFYYQPNLWFKAKVTNPYDIYFDNFKFNDYGNYPTQTTDTKGTYFYKKVPEIQGIYKRNPIAVTVPPNDSADVYLRTYVPNSMSFAPGTNYDTNLKVWWEKLI